jgi:hypothetical protein
MEGGGGGGGSGNVVRVSGDRTHTARAMRTRTDGVWPRGGCRTMSRAVSFVLVVGGGAACGALAWRRTHWTSVWSQP